MTDDDKLYALCVRDYAYHLVGPFEDDAALDAWAEAEHPDPNWHAISLSPGNLRPQIHGPDHHVPPGLSWTAPIDTTTEPSDLKHYAIFMTHTSYDLVGPFEDASALDAWGEIERGSNWQSVKLPDNFVPDLHEPDLNSELGFTDASIPVTSSPMSDDAKPYVLWIRDDEFFLIGPFADYAALRAWADAWDENRYDCDPRWNPIDLAGDLLPQVRGPDWHQPA